MNEVLILSGAGLSAESGLRTFRDSGGLWEEYSVAEICSIPGFQRDRQKVLDFYDKRRAQLADVAPNAAHEMVARVARRWGGHVSVMTQNVDDLLERAGCPRVVHLHGFLPEIYCEKCGRIVNIGYRSQAGELCPSCGTPTMRHNIVMFGEQAPFYRNLWEAISVARLFVCIGTSGEVLDVASFADAIGNSILNNYEQSRLDRHFTRCYIEAATKAAGKIERDIDEFLSALGFAPNPEI